MHDHKMIPPVGGGPGCIARHTPASPSMAVTENRILLLVTIIS